MLALNGKTYRLDETMTVIADDQGVHDIGGIMGGEHSGVTEATTDIVIECAYFDPERIARTGQKLGITSDARMRFERGVDPAFVEPGVQLATAMALELAGGEPSEVVRAGTPPPSTALSPIAPSAARAWPGSTCRPSARQEILARLGFEVTRGEPWQIRVPSWRRDVEGPADIVEEVARIPASTRCRRRRCRARRASPARPRRPSSRSSAAPGAPPPRAASTRR